MSAPRKLTAEELTDVLSTLKDLAGGWADDIRSHLAAIEQEHAAEVERLREDLAGAHGKAGRIEIDAAEACARMREQKASLRAEVEALKVDNAAFMVMLSGACHVCNGSGSGCPGCMRRVEHETCAARTPCPGATHTILAQPHPGASLLEEQRKALELLARIHPGVRELLTEHDASHRFHWSVRCITCAPRNARERALKEPES